MVDVKNPKVLIVILNYKTYELTINLAEQLKELNYNNYDILVVDNCSPNNSKQELEAKADILNYTFVSSKNNGGYAAGNNIGIRYAIEHGYEYSWILNNDVKIVDKDILKKLVECAESDEYIACVGPRIEDIDGYVTAPYVERPTVWSMTLGIVSEKKKRAEMKNQSGCVYRVYGCCMLLKNNYMKMVDCMDESTFLYCEEEILAERLTKVGAYFYYCADADIVHLESMTVGKEHGKKNLKKAKIVLKSMDVYLKEYRHFGWLPAFICKMVRGIILVFRG